MEKTILYFVVFAVLVFSCKNKNEIQDFSEKEITEAPTKTNQNENLIDFSFEIYENLIKKNSKINYSFSPVSLNLAMGMVYSGAEGETAKEICNLMGYDCNKKYFLNSISEYMDFLREIDKDTLIDFKLANKIYLEKTYTILPTYKDLIEKYFDGAFQLADFVKNARLEEKNINAWVEKMTNDRIKDLIPAGSLKPNTSMVLVNAIYIKSAWKYPFRESRNEKKDFFLSKKDKVKTDFMIQNIKRIKYADINSYKAIEMEYVNRNFSLLLVLPNESSIDNISDFVLNSEKYREICNSLLYQEVDIEIPKFKIESSFELSKLLKEMGMVSAFSNADFSGITQNNNLEISQVIQKVFFELDEKGSEAAAATAITMMTTSIVMEPEMKLTYEFIANRPFFYVLKENKYNTPLFIGQFVKP
ncbi:MAG: serpin family protein [Bacteroidales bacterium]|jgi:serpin B|nr:serpin family protein [Bacteroidales bacterium]MCK9499113.1 serpin family protein [Bacteroidales bacterium]MDY0314626.1 serpin family protein [Bacteroidales bacterium]NLB85885.1 serpin family protein [Bacteroidales bacterium]